MKTLLFTLVCIGCLVGCKEGDTKPEVRLFNHYFIFHKDTLIVEGTNKFDVQKLGVSESWNMIDSNNWYHYFEIKYGNKLYSLPLEDTSEVLQTDGAGVHGWVSVKEATFPKPEVIPQWRGDKETKISTILVDSVFPVQIQHMPYIYEDTAQMGYMPYIFDKDSCDHIFSKSMNISDSIRNTCMKCKKYLQRN